jgi:hypothetical protein
MVERVSPQEGGAEPLCSLRPISTVANASHHTMSSSLTAAMALVGRSTQPVLECCSLAGSAGAGAVNGLLPDELLSSNSVSQPPMLRAVPQQRGGLQYVSPLLAPLQVLGLAAAL